jgi:hypothetical protein
LNIITRKDVRTKLDGREHPNVRYYVDISTNANDSLKVSLLEDAHQSIDLAKPTCEVQQVKKISTTIQDAPFLVNLQNALDHVNLLSLSCLFLRNPLVKF